MLDYQPHVLGSSLIKTKVKRYSKKWEILATITNVLTSQRQSTDDKKRVKFIKLYSHPTARVHISKSEDFSSTLSIEKAFPPLKMTMQENLAS